MQTRYFENSPAGSLKRIIGGEYDGKLGFVPNPLPPALTWNDPLVKLVSQANHSLGILSGLAGRIPNPHLFILPFIKREAVISSRIEGTQSTISDLLIFEATSVEKQKDVQEVSNYVTALEYGFKRVTEIPISLKLIREIHSILMKDVRGDRSKPGFFREEPNWIGPQGCSLTDATYVPPPVPEMMQCLYDLENYFHTESNLPELVKIALIHYQFEAIHPFLDGNGRIGRLLIAFFLCERNLLTKPLFYISGYFEQNREEYNRLLLEVSKTGSWSSWIEYFLKGVVEQSKDSVERARKMIDLQEEYREIAQAKASPSALKLVDLIWLSPIITTKTVMTKLDLSWQGADITIKSLVQLGILKQLENKGRIKLYSAPKVMSVLS